MAPHIARFMLVLIVGLVLSHFAADRLASKARPEPSKDKK